MARLKVRDHEANYHFHSCPPVHPDPLRFPRHLVLKNHNSYCQFHNLRDDDRLKQSFRLKTSLSILRHCHLYSGKPHHPVGLVHHTGRRCTLIELLKFAVLDWTYITLSPKRDSCRRFFFTEHKFPLHKWHPQGTSAFFLSLSFRFRFFLATNSENMAQLALFEKTSAINRKLVGQKET